MSSLEPFDICFLMFSVRKKLFSDKIAPLDIFQQTGSFQKFVFASLPRQLHTFRTFKNVVTLVHSRLYFYRQRLKRTSNKILGNEGQCSQCELVYSQLDLDYFLLDFNF